MRIWLDPNKLSTYNLATTDVIAAVQAQNAQVAVGQLGGTPAVAGQQLNATVSAQDRMQTPEQFRAIVVRSSPDGSVLTLGDVARVELGAQTYEFLSRYNGQPAGGLAISLRPAPTHSQPQREWSGAQAMQPFFPAGMKPVCRSTRRRSCGPRSRKS